MDYLYWYSCSQLAGANELAEQVQEVLQDPYR